VAVTLSVAQLVQPTYSTDPQNLPYTFIKAKDLLYAPSTEHYRFPAVLIEKGTAIPVQAYYRP